MAIVEFLDFGVTLSSTRSDLYGALTMRKSDSQGFVGRMGNSMTIAAWILVAGLLAFAFNHYLDRQNNPNQEVQSRITDGQVKEVVLLRNRAGHYVATGKINGRDAHFLLDTGATAVSVPAELANELGLKRGPLIQTSTANGIINTYATTLTQVSLGDIVLDDVRASINPYMSSNEVLLGMAFLKQIELVQKGNTLTLRQYP